MKWPTTHNMDDTIAEAIEAEEMAVVVPLQLAIKLQETANTAGRSIDRCNIIDKAQLTTEEALAMVHAFFLLRNTITNALHTEARAVALYRALMNCDLREAIEAWETIVAM